MSDRLHCPGCGIPTIEGGPDTTEEELYCNRCVEELERNMSTNKLAAPVGGAQFTPGPWVVDEDYEDEEQQAIGIVKEGRGYIAGIHILASCNNGEGFTAEDRANAALIAAAPAMYEALSELVKYLRDEVADEALDTWAPVFKAAMALAQAEGR